MAVGGIDLDPSYDGLQDRLKGVRPARLPHVVVPEMYANLNGNGHAHAIGGWKADLRDYARWEYGTEEAAGWLLAKARRARRQKRTRLFARVRRLFRPEPQITVTTAVAVAENRGR